MDKTCSGLSLHIRSCLVLVTQRKCVLGQSYNVILITVAQVQPYVHTIIVNKRVHLQHRNKKIADFQNGYAIKNSKGHISSTLSITPSDRKSHINLQKPNVYYTWRTAPLTSKFSFYIFIQQIQVLNILNMVYTLRFFLFKMQFVS